MNNLKRRIIRIEKEKNTGKTLPDFICSGPISLIKYANSSKDHITNPHYKRQMPSRKECRELGFHNIQYIKKRKRAAAEGYEILEIVVYII